MGPSLTNRIEIAARRENADVPAILNFMRQVPEFTELDAPDFRFFITGAAPMPETLTQLYNDKGMEVKGLVGEVSLQHQNTAKKLEVVHKKEQAIVKELKERIDAYLTPEHCRA